MFDASAPFRSRQDWRYEAAWNQAEEHGSIMGGHPLSFFVPILSTSHAMMNAMNRIHRITWIIPPPSKGDDLSHVLPEVILTRPDVGRRVRAFPELAREHQARERRRDADKQAHLGRKAEMRAQKSAHRGRGRDRR